MRVAEAVRDAVLPSSCLEVYLEFEYLWYDGTISAGRLLPVTDADVATVLGDEEVCRRFTLTREDGFELTACEDGARDFGWDDRYPLAGGYRVVRLCWSAGGVLHRDIARYDHLRCLNLEGVDGIEVTKVQNLRLGK